MRFLVIAAAVCVLIGCGVPAAGSPLDAESKEASCHANPKDVTNKCGNPIPRCGDGPNDVPCGAATSAVPLSKVYSSTIHPRSLTEDPASKPQSTGEHVEKPIRGYRPPRNLRLPSTHAPAPIPATTYVSVTFKPHTSSAEKTAMYPSETVAPPSSFTFKL